MKLIYADMSIKQAERLLKTLGYNNCQVIDLKFGYSVMRAQISNLPIYHTDCVYLTNVPDVLSIMMDEVEYDELTQEQKDDFMNKIYLLKSDCDLLQVHGICKSFARNLADKLLEILEGTK